MSVVERLRKNLLTVPPVLPKWIHVGNDSIPSIIRSLDYWITNCSKREVGVMLQHHVHERYEALEFRRKMSARTNAYTAYEGAELMARQNVKEHLDSRTDEEIISMESVRLLENDDGIESDAESYEEIPTQRSARARFIQKARENLLDWMEWREHATRESSVLLREKAFYKAARVFVPPPKLWSRHGTLLKLWRAYQDLNPRDSGYAKKLKALNTLKNSVSNRSLHIHRSICIDTLRLSR